MKKTRSGKSRDTVPLKVSTNEKRDGLKLVAYVRSPFQLISLRFSNKSVQAQSCGRPITTLRTMFLSFAFKSCLQITA
jgi:hypothetical protein